MRGLGQELFKTGIIEKMVGDTLPDKASLEGEGKKAEAKTNKLLERYARYPRY